MRSRALGGFALLVIGCDEHVGCTPVLQGESAQLEFHDQTLVVGAADRLHEVRAIVEGSRFCPQLGCVGDVPGCTIDEDDDVRLSEPEVRQCYTSTLAGPVTIDGTCIVADAPGELDWSLAPQACEADAHGYRPGAERLRLPIVDAARVQPWLQAPGDGFALRELAPADGGEFPEAPQLSPGSRAYVIADETVHFAIVLDHPDADAPVAWTPSSWTVSAEGDGAVALDEWGVVALTVPAGGSLALTLQRDALALPIGRVEAVEPEAIASLEIVAGFVPDGGAPDGHRVPVGARAVARTADDRVVFGVPVTWRITKGALPLWRDETLQWDPDYTALADRDGRGCHPPPDEDHRYEVELAASWRALAATTTLVWTEPKVDEGFLGELSSWFKGHDWHAADTCEGPGFPDEGCGCTQQRGGAPLLVIVALLLRRRRLSRPAG